MQRRDSLSENPAYDSVGVELCFGDSDNSCTNVLTISRSSIPVRPPPASRPSGGADIALVEVDGHSPLQQPTLSLTGSDLAPNAQIGAYAFVVGYPYPDGRLPPLFVDRLLEAAAGVRRVMPGRILAFSEKRYTSDISTMAGVGGGPLVDLSSGAVLAVNLAGVWDGGRGKFAYAYQIPAEVREIIDRRLRGEEDPKSTVSQGPGRTPKPQFR